MAPASSPWSSTGWDERVGLAMVMATVTATVIMMMNLRKGFRAGAGSGMFSKNLPDYFVLPFNYALI